MPIQSVTVGPGSFTIGSGPLAVSCQVTALTVAAAENITTDEAVHTLCGDVLPAEDTVTLEWTLEGNLLQDYTTGGVVDYTWTNASDEVAFTYIPNTVADKQVTGTVRLVPISVGGEVTKRGRSDFTWVIIGTPTFGDVP